MGAAVRQRGGGALQPASDAANRGREVRDVIDLSQAISPRDAPRPPREPVVPVAPGADRSRRPGWPPRPPGGGPAGRPRWLTTADAPWRIPPAPRVGGRPH